MGLLLRGALIAFGVNSAPQVVASVFTFALMSPLGAIIGMAVQSAASNSFSKDVTITVLQGLAVGTFLYVTFFEVCSPFDLCSILLYGFMKMFQVLLHERDNEHPNLLKLLVMLIGFSLIGLLRLVDNHDHDLSHSLGNSTQIGAVRGAHFGHHHHHHDHHDHSH